MRPADVIDAAQSSFANVGRSVVNCWYVRSGWPGSGAAFLSAPSIVSPFANTSVTFLAATWPLNSVDAHCLWPAEAISEGEHPKQNAVAHNPHRRRDPPPALSGGITRREALSAPWTGGLLIPRRLCWLTIRLGGGSGGGSLLGHDARSQVS